VNRRGLAVWDLAVGLAVIVIAVAVGIQSMAIPVSPGYARVGPKVIPYIVAFGLLILGLVLSVQAWRGGWSEEAEDQAHPVDWRSLRWLVCGLVINVASIAWAGFVIASSLMFVCVARAFGSVRPARDLGIGVVVTVVAYLGFDKALGINIGAGLLGGIL